eukprot:12221780-Alexandrium_andersonii.AAC.1
MAHALSRAPVHPPCALGPCPGVRSPPLSDATCPRVRPCWARSLEPLPARARFTHCHRDAGAPCPRSVTAGILHAVLGSALSDSCGR